MVSIADQIAWQRARLPKLKSRTTVQNLGGQAFTTERNTLQFDVSNTTLEDVQWMLKSIAFEEIGEQADMGNIVSQVLVDGRASKDILTAKRKIQALFGARMERQAMRLAEDILQQAIDRTTTARTGALRNVRGEWEWVFAVRNDAPGIPVTNDLIGSMPPGSYLILRPRLDYAGIANVTPKAGQYLALAARMMRGKRPFANFKITAGVSRKFKVGGEKSWLGTPFIRLGVKGRI
jgi:hypothetical protein